MVQAQLHLRPASLPYQEYVDGWAADTHGYADFVEGFERLEQRPPTRHDIKLMARYFLVSRGYGWARDHAAKNDELLVTAEYPLCDAYKAAPQSFGWPEWVLCAYQSFSRTSLHNWRNETVVKIEHTARVKTFWD